MTPINSTERKVQPEALFINEFNKYLSKNNNTTENAKIQSNIYPFKKLDEGSETPNATIQNLASDILNKSFPPLLFAQSLNNLGLNKERTDYWSENYHLLGLITSDESIKTLVDKIRLIERSLQRKNPYFSETTVKNLIIPQGTIDNLKRMQELRETQLPKPRQNELPQKIKKQKLKNPRPKEQSNPVSEKKINPKLLSEKDDNDILQSFLSDLDPNSTSYKPEEKEENLLDLSYSPLRSESGEKTQDLIPLKTLKRKKNRNVDNELINDNRNLIETLPQKRKRPEEGTYWIPPIPRGKKNNFTLCVRYKPKEQSTQNATIIIPPKEG